MTSCTPVILPSIPPPRRRVTLIYPPSHSVLRTEFVPDPALTSSPDGDLQHGVRDRAVNQMDGSGVVNW